MPPGYLDVYPEPVGNAGRQTAATSTDWAAWSGRSESRLRSAGGSARSTKVSTAFENYLSQWNPTFRNLGVRAENLGGNAVAASGTVVSSDGEGEGILRDRTVTAENQGSQLTRPINAQ